MGFLAPYLNSFLRVGGFWGTGRGVWNGGSLSDRREKGGVSAEGGSGFGGVHGATTPAKHPKGAPQGGAEKRLICVPPGRVCPEKWSVEEDSQRVQKNMGEPLKGGR